MSGMYISVFAKFHGRDLDYENDTVSALLIDTDLYAPNRETDQNIGDIPDEAILSETVLTNRFIDGTALYSDPAVFESVESNTLIGRAVVIYFSRDTTTASALFLLFDSDASTQLPVTPDGTDIIINWPSEGLFVTEVLGT